LLVVDSAQGTIVIRPKFFILAFLLYFFTPKASINGREVPLRWKVPHPVPVPPGRYEVGVWVPYLFFPRMGYSAVVVDVHPGAAIEVVWNAPLITFMAGSISVQHVDPRLVQAQAPQQQQFHQAQAPRQLPQQQAQAVGGGGGSWQPDPSGRHQYRWWDGTSWAPDVSDGGVTSRDPL
jgi:hypothetical protein